MSDQYEDEEEYYGDEEEYAEDEEVEDYEEDEEGAPAAKPKKDWVRTAIFGIAGVLVLGGVGYYAATVFMPDTVNDVVNNLPFISKGEEEFADVPNGETPPPDGAAQPGAPGEAAPPPDVAAVPPDPAKATAMKPRRPAPTNAAPKPMTPRRMPKPAVVANTEGMPPPAARPKATPPKAWRPAPKPASTWAAKQAAARRAAAARQARATTQWKRRPGAGVGVPIPAGRYAVQVGSFAYTANATQLVNQLRSQGLPAYSRAAYRGGMARVYIGNYPSRQAAAVKMYQLQSQGIPAAVTFY